jgi:hypothetical protein
MTKIPLKNFVSYAEANKLWPNLRKYTRDAGLEYTFYFDGAQYYAMDGADEIYRCEDNKKYGGDIEWNVDPDVLLVEDELKESLISQKAAKLVEALIK